MSPVTVDREQGQWNVYADLDWELLNYQPHQPLKKLGQYLHTIGSSGG
ncbi:hypothetical protein VB715_07070 [Crocosphaera sp. UHCC 0190]|nr:hypothetical protein [Crocosphaera sp. UHCC 0190]MEA5509521.1 hypothetical protein [Crocosphaera sp. UHCC 0190]